MVFKDLIIPILLFFGSMAEARNVYFATYVPQSLQNLGYSSATSWVGDCANCHRTSGGGQPGVPDLNAGFGRDFYAFVSNTGTDFPQATVQMIIQGIETLDSDSDGATNLQEYRGRTNPNDPLSKPAVQGDGGSDVNPGDFFKEGDATKTNLKLSNSDAAYSLSGCNTDEPRSSRAGLATPSGTAHAWWVLPLLVLFWEFRRPRF